MVSLWNPNTARSQIKAFLLAYTYRKHLQGLFSDRTLPQRERTTAQPVLDVSTRRPGTMGAVFPLAQPDLKLPGSLRGELCLSAFPHFLSQFLHPSSPGLQFVFPKLFSLLPDFGSVLCVCLYRPSYISNFIQTHRWWPRVLTSDSHGTQRLDPRG